MGSKIETAKAPGAAREEWVRDATARLTEAGYRSGGARMAVVALLGAEGGCLEVEDVASKLRRRGKSVGTASVYRALSVLTELGLVHKVVLGDAPARFDLVLPDGDHHHHLVCDECGLTKPFHDLGLERAVEDVSRRASFKVQAHDVTLHGTCEACAPTS